MGSDTLIAARGLRKTYGEGTGRTVALDGVDLEVRRGELLAVVGPSGSGKTTLLHCLAGITAPDGGRVLLDGEDLTDLDDDARSELRTERMGFVLQTSNLLPALTAAENVQLPLMLQQLDAAAIRTRTEAALAAVGLAERHGAFPAELSAGEQQRVAIARAVVTEPDVIWADEPTGALDTDASAAVLELLHTAAEPGRTVVMVTHDRAQSAAADRVVTLRDGRIAPAASSTVRPEVADRHEPHARRSGGGVTPA